MLTSAAVAAIHRRGLSQLSKELTSDTRIALALSQSRHVRMLARAALLASDRHVLSYLRKEFASRTQ